jgi:hypothetical protein
VVAILISLCVVEPALSSTGMMDATSHYACDDNGGWVNWDATNGNVVVSDSALAGYSGRPTSAGSTSRRRWAALLTTAAAI